MGHARVGAMRLATIRTEYGTTAARLDGDVLAPLEAADVGELLAAGGLGRSREGAAPVPVAQADFAPVVPRPAGQEPSARAASRSSEARSLSAVVARARGRRFSSVSRVQS